MDINPTSIIKPAHQLLQFMRNALIPPPSQPTAHLQVGILLLQSSYHLLQSPQVSILYTDWQWSTYYLMPSLKATMASVRQNHSLFHFVKMLTGLRAAQNSAWQVCGRPLKPSMDSYPTPHTQNIPIWLASKRETWAQLSPQHPCGSWQLSVTPVPGDSMPLLTSTGSCMHTVYICMLRHTCIHIKSNKY